MKWQPNNQTRQELLELRRDFREGWPDGLKVSALRISGMPAKAVHWQKLQSALVTTLWSRSEKVVATAMGELEGCTYALIGPAKTGDAVLINERYCSPAMEILWQLGKSGFPSINTNRRTWNRGAEWLRIVFGLLEEHESGAIDSAHLIEDSNGLIQLVTSTNLQFTLESSLPGARPELTDEAKEEGFNVTLEYEHVEVLSRDILRASADAIQWILREADRTAPIADKKLKVSDAEIVADFSDRLGTLNSKVDELHNSALGVHDKDLFLIHEQVISSAFDLYEQVDVPRDALIRQGLLTADRKNMLADLAVSLDFLANVLRASQANGWGYRVTEESASANAVKQWNEHWHKVRHVAINMRQWTKAMSDNRGESSAQSNVDMTKTVMRSGAWFYKATGQLLEASALNRQRERGKHPEAEKPNGRWYYPVDSVCQQNEDYRPMIEKALAKEQDSD